MELSKAGAGHRWNKVLYEDVFYMGLSLQTHNLVMLLHKDAGTFVIGSESDDLIILFFVESIVAVN